jgi:hypothetical protein
MTLDECEARRVPAWIANALYTKDFPTPGMNTVPSYPNAPHRACVRAYAMRERHPADFRVSFRRRRKKFKLGEYERPRKGRDPPFPALVHSFCNRFQEAGPPARGGRDCLRHSDDSFARSRYAIRSARSFVSVTPA